MSAWQTDEDRGVRLSFTATNRTCTRYGSNYWSCVRNSANNAWYANGSTGNFNNNNMLNRYVAVPVSNYQQLRMIDIEDIIEAYMTARRNKRRSPDQVEFELHWERNCVRLYEDVINRRVRPTAYIFVTTIPRPREVFASDMSTRILHHYLDMRLRPLLEKRMSDHTFNNRVGMGQNACQNALISDIYEVSHGFTRDAWIVKVDMSGCFPNISQDIAYKQLEEVVVTDYDGADKEEVLYMLNVCIFSYPTHHCYRKSPLSAWRDIPDSKSLFRKRDGIGAAIGHLIWQNAVNYYFHEIDEWVLSLDIKYERFVDDMVFVTDNKEAFLPYVLPEIRKRLATLGAMLNEKKFYCQHYTKGVEWIGCHIKMDRVYPNERIVRRGIAKAIKLNRRIKPGRVPHLLASINSYLGICKNMNGYNQAWRILKHLSPKWRQYVRFNRRRACLQAQPDYNHRNRIIKQFKLR